MWNLTTQNSFWILNILLNYEKKILGKINEVLFKVIMVDNILYKFCTITFAKIKNKTSDPQPLQLIFVV